MNSVGTRLRSTVSQFINQQSRPTGLRNYLVLGTAGTFTLQIASSGLGFITNILLARFLGTTEYGAYTYVAAWMGVLTIVAMSGMGQVLIREVAAYHEHKEWALLSGILRWAAKRGVLLSIGIALAAGVGAWLIRDHLDPHIFPAIWAALAILPVLTLLRLSGAAMDGLKQVVLGRISDVVIRLPLHILLFSVFYLLFSQALNAFWTMVLAGVAMVVAALVSFRLLYKKLPHETFTSAPAFQSRLWLASALPLLLAAGLAEINTRAPTLMLGAMAKIEDVGVYNVADLLTGFVNMILISISVALSPVIAGLYRSGNMRRLQKIITISARGTLLCTIAISLVLFLLRNWLLDFFGTDFQAASPILLLLIISQLINVVAGSAGILLVMTGHERDVVKAMVVGTVFLVVLNAILIPMLGVIGAAFAVIGSMILWNGILIVLLHRRTGIDPTALGWFSRWNSPAQP